MTVLVSPEDFLRAFHVEGHQIELRGLREKGGPVRRYWNGSGTPFEDVHRDLKRGVHAYTFGPACRRLGSATGKKSDLTVTRAVWSDIDSGGPDEALRRARFFGLPDPHVLLPTRPGRCHAYYFIAESLDLSNPKTRADFEGVERGLAILLGGDPQAVDATRVLRMPYMVGKKDEKQFVPEIARWEPTASVLFKDLPSDLDAFHLLFRPHHRHAMTLFLAGYGLHHGVAKDRVRALVERFGAGEHFSEVDGTYAKPKEEVAWQSWLEESTADCPWVREPLLAVLGKIVRTQRTLAHPTSGAASSAEADEVWTISTRKSIQWTPRGIDLIVHHEEYDDVIPVVVGHVRPLQQVDLEGDIFFKVKLDREVVTTAEGLRKRLDREAKVVAHGNLSDVLNQVLLHFAPTPVKAHATFGVYEDEGGRLDLCTNPMTVWKEQETAHREVVRAINYTTTPPDLQAYVDFLPLVHGYEVLPAMGLAAIAPFALILRRHDTMVPHLWNYSHEHGLGKSLVAGAFSGKMWGRQAIGGDALDSEFRFPALFDATSAPLWIDEAERLDPKKHGAALKASAEREISDKRGTAELSMVTYYSRAILFATGNTFPFISASVMTRFIAVRYDATMVAVRRISKAKADARYAALRPVGLSVVKAALSMFPTTADLVARVRTREAEIAAAYPGQFDDPRRGQVWAVVYVGLESWAAALAGAGIPWFPPDVPSFVRDVVMPVEASMWESVELPVEAFRSWWALWRVKNTILHRSGEATWESPKGKGDVWDEGEVEVGNTVIVGTWITKPILVDYNKQAAPDLKIPTLTELAKMVVMTWGLPDSEMLDPKEKKLGKEKPPVRRFGAKTNRAVFVPDEEASPAAVVDERQTVLEDSNRARVYPLQKAGNHVTNDPSDGENPVTQEGNTLPNEVTPVLPIANDDRYRVTQRKGFPVGLDEAIRRALRSRSRYAAKPATFIAKDLCKEFGLVSPEAETLVLARIAGLSEEFRSREDEP